MINDKKWDKRFTTNCLIDCSFVNFSIRLTRIIVYFLFSIGGCSKSIQISILLIFLRVR